MGARGRLPKNKIPTADKKPVPVRIVSDTVASKPDKSYEARERRYRAEDALRDLERAEAHKRDKTLMGDVKSLAREKMESLGKIK